MEAWLILHYNCIDQGVDHNVDNDGSLADPALQLYTVDQGVDHNVDNDGSLTDPALQLHRSGSRSQCRQ